MNDEEIQEILKQLEAAGWQPQLCDTPIPVYDNPVRCGQPTGIGDVVERKKRFPKEFLSMQPEFVVKVKGDSMEGADIHNGDSVRVESEATVHDSDIVLACIDGEFTLKAYCEDEDGMPWLVPQNDNYEAFALTENDNAWIVGKVTEVIRAAPRVPARTCMKLIKKAKMKEPTRELSQLQISRAIREIAPMVMTGRQWYAVYRAMADRNVVREGDFEGFCKMIREEVSKHEHLPTPVEMQRLAVQSFAKSVRQWQPGNAPVQGKRYNDYLEIARRMEKLLTT